MAKKALNLQELKNTSERDRAIARNRIRVGNIIGKLQEAALGTFDPSANQVRAAEILLKCAGMITNKTEIETTINHQHSITDETLKLLRSANERIALQNQSTCKVINADLVTATHAEVIQE